MNQERLLVSQNEDLQASWQLKKRNIVGLEENLEQLESLSREIQDNYSLGGIASLTDDSLQGLYHFRFELQDMMIGEQNKHHNEERYFENQLVNLQKTKERCSQEDVDEY